jgi:hypothetical protein
LLALPGDLWLDVYPEDEDEERAGPSILLRAVSLLRT